VKKYGTVTAVEGLSLRVAPGTMFGFSAQRLGQEHHHRLPDRTAGTHAGQIEILGQRFDAESAAIKQRMGVMPETLGLFDPLYAHEFPGLRARACTG